MVELKYLYMLVHTSTAFQLITITSSNLLLMLSSLTTLWSNLEALLVTDICTAFESFLYYINIHIWISTIYMWKMFIQEALYHWAVIQPCHLDIYTGVQVWMIAPTTWSLKTWWTVLKIVTDCAMRTTELTVKCSGNIRTNILLHNLQVSVSRIMKINMIYLIMKTVWTKFCNPYGLILFEIGARTKHPFDQMRPVEMAELNKFI